jgi:predicted nucleic acid-binding protein
VAALVDTNVLVYRYDERFPDKQRIATRLLRDGLARDVIRVPHQAVVELVAAVIRPIHGRESILPREEAWHEAEELLLQFPILYPNADVVRTALRGAATYGLSWWDAHLWAHAEVFGLEEILSEDFQPGRTYGSVRIVNPFA